MAKYNATSQNIEFFKSSIGLRPALIVQVSYFCNGVLHETGFVNSYGVVLKLKDYSMPVQFFYAMEPFINIPMIKT